MREAPDHPRAARVRADHGHGEGPAPLRQQLEAAARVPPAAGAACSGDAEQRACALLQDGLCQTLPLGRGPAGPLEGYEESGGDQGEARVRPHPESGLDHAAQEALLRRQRCRQGHQRIAALGPQEHERFHTCQLGRFALLGPRAAPKPRRGFAARWHHGGEPQRVPQPAHQRDEEPHQQQELGGPPGSRAQGPDLTGASANPGQGQQGEKPDPAP
mmetsp:Transcript_59147/g.183484  ORF Transcript_59147/g.183484 Transcript_59147/m.183484 type:complete len:216 (-) Transcript_59147:671-1318(-)